MSIKILIEATILLLMLLTIYSLSIKSKDTLYDAGVTSRNKCYPFSSNNQTSIITFYNPDFILSGCDYVKMQRRINKI